MSVVSDATVCGNGLNQDEDGRRSGSRTYEFRPACMGRVWLQSASTKCLVVGF